MKFSLALIPRTLTRIALAFFSFSTLGLATSSSLLAQGVLPVPNRTLPSSTQPALGPPLPPAYPTPAFPMGAYPMGAYPPMPPLYPASEPPVSMLISGLLSEYQAYQDEDRK